MFGFEKQVWRLKSIPLEMAKCVDVLGVADLSHFNEG